VGKSLSKTLEDAAMLAKHLRLAFGATNSFNVYCDGYAYFSVNQATFARLYQELRVSKKAVTIETSERYVHFRFRARLCGFVCLIPKAEVEAMCQSLSVAPVAHIADHRPMPLLGVK
jgi:hypothetical protein